MERITTGIVGIEVHIIPYTYSDCYLWDQPAGL